VHYFATTIRYSSDDDSDDDDDDDDDADGKLSSFSMRYYYK